MRAVCFDNDGLVLDTESAYTRAQEILFERRGRTFTPDHKRYMIGSSGTDQQRRYEELLELPGEGVALAEEMHELALEEMARGIEPMPGAFALIDALRTAGTPVALVSNSPRVVVELCLRTANVGDRFDVVYARDDVAHGKPAPDLYLKACATLGADPSASVGLEDTPTGVAAVKAAGLFAIGIPSYPGVFVDQADLQAESLADAAVHRAVGL